MAAVDERDCTLLHYNVNNPCELYQTQVNTAGRFCERLAEVTVMNLSLPLEKGAAGNAQHPRSRIRAVDHT